jgi:tRNA dimethylallyltransferase
MDVGTAKPTAEERAAVRHYLIDLVEPHETYSAQRYREEGMRVLRRIGASGRVAFVVGGTGFYIRALLDGASFPSVPPDPDLRFRLSEKAERTGAAALHGELAERDPASASRIHPNNLARTIRALEIIEHLGGPVPTQSVENVIPALYLGLDLDRPTLHRIADQRVVAQGDAGLIEETRLLLEMGYSGELPALQGFAYRQAVAHLAGRMTLDEAIADYQVATHQYIRRQMTWFRQDKRVRWIDASSAPVRLARTLIEEWLSRD